MSPGAISPLSEVKALTCDVFGTVVDWRSSVTEELTLRAFRKTSSDLDQALKTRLQALTDEDWGRFAQEWRNSYGRFTKGFDPEKHTWKTIDQHHHDSLIELLQAWNLTGLYSPSEIESLSLVWHRLTPWGDSSDGIQKLGKTHKTSTLSNGNLSLLRDLNDFGNLGFQYLLSAEKFAAYKPNPAVYSGAVRELGLEPHQVAMVAAHLNDLEAARACGLRTVYIERPREEAWGVADERFQRAQDWVDVWITENDQGFLTLAQKLEELA
ncbi:HAD-like domain-containing protein [Fusarium tricinctum]|jgi:2-haloacid dehalogenase|uniref:HAD-like domain-containing protein n=2 Tax=Fusarium tricinctum species complex TaxID=679429 RepID=A0A8K0WI84_9HYPO|nr:HAD-like domain-containing protein [Fusarium tricinctum]